MLDEKRAAVTVLGKVQGSVCAAAIRNRLCPLWVKSGHRSTSAQCPLYPQKRTSLSVTGMSRFVPKAEVGRLLDDPIRSCKHGRRDGDSQRLGAVQIDYKLEYRRSLNRQLCRRTTFEDAVHKIGGTTI